MAMKKTAGFEAPGTRAVARARRRDADRLAALVSDHSGDRVLARAARAAAIEAGVARSVASWGCPVVDGDPGPSAVGRGQIEAGDVLVMVYCPRDGGERPAAQRVARRSVSRSLKNCSAAAVAAAEHYAALAEQIGSIAGADLLGDRIVGSGVSDGGAVRRCEIADDIAIIEAAIGRDLVLVPTRQSRVQTGRPPRRAITARELVDAVVLHGRAIEDVLGRAGWARGAKPAETLRRALDAALVRCAAAMGNRPCA